jgi:RNA polymerase sigma factor (sigma-70 family)
MTTDSELLRQYAQEHAEAAFTEVVHRYVAVAYSVALRLAGGDRQLAEDAAQGMFTEMARQAATLASRETLAGWVHITTRNCAINLVRKERRRRSRELEAHTMQIDSFDEKTINWEQMRPLLDEAVAQLGERDAGIVVSRFFQEKSHKEIGQAFGLSEEAARKRIDRAVEKLRTYFTRRGITVSAGLLGEIITAHGAHAAPAMLADNLAATALAQAATAPTGLILTLKTILTMSTTTKVIIAAVAAIAAVATYHSLATTSPAGEPAASSAGPVAAKAVQPRVALPTSAPAPAASSMVAAPSAAATPTDGKAPMASSIPATANSPANYDALVQESAQQIMTMKKTFVELALTLKDPSDLVAAREKVKALEESLNQLLDKTAGTPIQEQLMPAVNALKMVQKPLEDGDFDGARAVMDKLVHGTPSKQTP